MFSFEGSCSCVGFCSCSAASLAHDRFALTRALAFDLVSALLLLFLLLLLPLLLLVLLLLMFLLPAPAFEPALALVLLLLEQTRFSRAGMISVRLAPKCFGCYERRVQQMGEGSTVMILLRQLALRYTCLFLCFGARPRTVQARQVQ